MKLRWRFAAALCMAVAVGGAYWLLGMRRGPESSAQRPVFDPAELLGGAAEGYARVEGDGRLRFPQDHLAHPDFRGELWTLATHLVGAEGRRFGLQIVLLRVALALGAPPADSAWATHQVYRGQMSLADLGAGRFVAFERYSRAALGLSGASADPPRLWVEDWTIEMEEVGGATRLRLKAAEEGVGVELALTATKPPLPIARALVGEDASAPPIHAYAITRLTAQGTIAIDGERWPVTGAAWFDHAWGEVPVGQGQTALNRFLLQFDDGSELLAVQLHRRGGGGRPVVSGLRIGPDGAVRRYDQGEIHIAETAIWRSPVGQLTYPARWTITIPADDWRADIEPRLADQEIRLTTRYWSGTVHASARAREQAMVGNGFVDLTGY